MLLHVALNGEARWLISGGQDLLTLAPGILKSHGLRIVSPKEYLETSG